MDEEEYKRHFEACFTDKRDSYLPRYLRFLETHSLKTDSTLSESNRRREETRLRQDLGYEKWKTIPMEYFRERNLRKELSDDVLNTCFMKPEHCFYASYILLQYFKEKNHAISSFLYDRLMTILRQKNTWKDSEIPNLKQERRLLRWKIRNSKDLTEEDISIVKKIYGERNRTFHPRKGTAQKEIGTII